MGVSDLSVGRKMKILVENFYGRLIAYSESFDDISLKKNNEKLILSVTKNFKDEKITKISDSIFLSYVTANISFLNNEAIDYDNLGSIKFEVI